MRRSWGVAAVVAAGGLAAFAPPGVDGPLATPQATPDALIQLDARVREAFGDGEGHGRGAGQCEPTTSKLIALSAAPQFDRLPPDTLALVLREVVACRGETPTADDLALIRRLEPAVSDARIRGAANAVLLLDALDNDRMVEAADRLVILLHNDASMVAAGQVEEFEPYIRAVKDDDARSIALLSTLTAVPWSRAETRERARNGWSLDLARRLADAGRSAEAAKALADADQVGVLLQVAADRRFEAAWPAMQRAGRFDFRAHTEAELARLQSRADRSGQDALDMVQTLRALRRYDEAVAVAREAAAAKPGRGKNSQDDLQNRAWILNELAYALFDTGDTAGGEAALREAIAGGERGRPSVSQRINLAEKLVRLDRPKEALALVAEIPSGGASPYGIMWADAVRACANRALDPAAADRMLASMKAREADNPAALQSVLLCLDRPDEAAALYIRRLGSPALRPGALGAFRKDLPPPHMTPIERELEARRQAVIARPDVQAALRAVGRPVESGLAGVYWGEL